MSFAPGRVAALIVMAAAGPAVALEARLDAGLQAHQLRERDANGATLVREQGLAPRLDLTLSQPLGDAWALGGAVGAWASRARYDGQSQGGVPIDSRTDTQALTFEAGLRWQPGTPAGLSL
ncbi:MAG TPA: hypothetical protein VJ598_02515, partial [Albitalea sp.]|nr:hypothetical protein [Albitalea sp.]